MPTTKRLLKRYSILDRCFSNTGRNYTFDGLKEAINEWMLDKDPQSKGISTRQLRDDIAFMNSSDGWEAPTETYPGEGKKRYYRYDNPKFSINKRPINQTQVEELKMALDAFDCRDNLVVLDTNVPKDITVDPEKHFDPIVGVSRPMDGEIEIQLAPATYSYVKTKPIHHSQKNYDEEYKVKISVVRNRRLENIIYTLGL